MVIIANIEFDKNLIFQKLLFIIKNTIILMVISTLTIIKYQY